LPSYGARLIYINSYQPSPDGLQIAFAAAEPGEGIPTMSQRGQAAAIATHPILQDIWLMDPDGANSRRIADLGLATPSIAWSPDGAWVYVMSLHGFLRINVKTGAQQELAAGYVAGRIRLLRTDAAR
jgi:Tol biopolymer transport system component